jgi:acetolactate synthase-1/2/3 large subunit
MINPDFIKLAEAYDIKAAKVVKREDLAAAVKEMIASKESYFLEVMIEKEDNVFPMVPTGACVSEVRLS